MIGTKKVIGFALVAALLLGLASVASAQPVHLQPGSCLVYPLFDSSPGAGTVICVTNINDSRIYCEDTDFREGDIMVSYVYIDGVTWQEFDRFEFLTPGDTLCVLADNHNPEQNEGFLFVCAVDPSDMSQRVAFDYLIGSAIVVKSDLNFLWAYTPYAFRGIGDRDNESSSCPLKLTDVDEDGAADFDGEEYDYFPRTLFIDSFFQEGMNFANELTLLTSAGSSYRAEVNFLIWNNIEQKFSRNYTFTCWTSVPLSSISNIARNLGGDPNEFGHQSVQTGWASIKGSRILDLAGNPVPSEDEHVTAVPPLLGTFFQSITNFDFSAGHALHYKGTLDGLEMLVGDGDPQRL